MDLALTYDLGTTHCIICHQTNSGGIGTVVHPFGLAMKAAGLHLEDTTSLQNALHTLDANKTDSDCDGTPDIEQLKMGRDPNPPGELIDGSGRTAPADPGCMPDGGSDATLPVPVFGCDARVSSAPAAWPGAVGLAAMLALLRTRVGVRRRAGERARRPRRRR
jgi:MYXO-CTERM domain-containing protein